MGKPAFSRGLQASLDQAMVEFPHGKSKSNALKPIYKWLEIDEEDNVDVEELGFDHIDAMTDAFEAKDGIKFARMSPHREGWVVTWGSYQKTLNKPYRSSRYESAQ